MLNNNLVFCQQDAEAFYLGNFYVDRLCIYTKNADQHLDFRMGYTDEEVQFFIEEALERCTLGRISQSDFIDCFCMLRLASADPGGDSNFCKCCVHLQKRMQLNLPEEKLQFSHGKLKCALNMKDKKILCVSSSLNGSVTTEKLLLGLKAAKAAGEIQRVCENISRKSKIYTFPLGNFANLT